MRLSESRHFGPNPNPAAKLVRITLAKIKIPSDIPSDFPRDFV